jgi:hypothetical protein
MILTSRKQIRRKAMSADSTKSFWETQLGGTLRELQLIGRFRSVNK